MVVTTKFIIHYIDSRYTHIIKFFSIASLVKIFTYHFLHIKYSIIKPVITTLNFFITICILSILILAIYYFIHFYKHHFFALALLIISLIVSFFDGNNHFFLRGSRHLIIFLNLSFLYFLAFNLENKESQRAFYSFVYVSLVLFLISNLLKDIQLFYENTNFEKAILFLQEKNTTLQIIACLFPYIDMALDLLKNRVNKIKLFFSLTIFTIYGLILFWFLSYHQLISSQSNLLENIFQHEQNFFWLFYFIYILYYFNEDKNISLISFIVLVMSISFQIDNPFNSFLVITGFLFIVLPLLKKEGLTSYSLNWSEKI